MKAKKMANMSSSGIESVIQCLSKAVEAARCLDSNLSQNLCFALNIANSEAGRVAKSMRKTSTQQKTAKTAMTARTAKPAAKSTRTAISAKPQPQSKSRSKPRTLNGAVAH